MGILTFWACGRDYDWNTSCDIFLPVLWMFVPKTQDSRPLCRGPLWQGMSGRFDGCTQKCTQESNPSLEWRVWGPTPAPSPWQWERSSGSSTGPGRRVLSSWTRRLETLQRTPCPDFPSRIGRMSTKLPPIVICPGGVIDMTLEMGKAQIWAANRKSDLKLLVWTLRQRRSRLSEVITRVQVSKHSSNLAKTQHTKFYRQDRLQFYQGTSAWLVILFQTCFKQLTTPVKLLIRRPSRNASSYSPFVLLNWSHLSIKRVSKLYLVN